MPTPTPKPPIPKPLIDVPDFKKPVRDEVEKKVRQRFGIPQNKPLPRELDTLIDQVTSTSTGKAIDLAVDRDTDAAIRKAYRPAQLDGFKDKVSAARVGIDLIAQSQDVDSILKRRAELLFKKRQALVTAGFREAEAMEIVLADLSGQR